MLCCLRGICRSPALRNTALATASPVFALPLAVGITDPPIIALACLALACLRVRPSWLVVAGLAIGAACAMKATASLAVPVIAAMLAFRDGQARGGSLRRRSRRHGGGTRRGDRSSAVAEASAFLQNTVLFPLGLTRQLTPATSPLPGHLLASAGGFRRPPGSHHPAGHGRARFRGLTRAVAAPERVCRDPAARLGTGLMFTLAPATRLGYFAYPAALLGWLAPEWCFPGHAELAGLTGFQMSGRARRERFRGCSRLALAVLWLVALA